MENSSGHTERKADAPDVQPVSHGNNRRAGNHGTLSPVLGQLLDLQRTAGNAAVAGAMAQSSSQGPSRHRRDNPFTDTVVDSRSGRSEHAVADGVQRSVQVQRSGVAPLIDNWGGKVVKGGQAPDIARDLATSPTKLFVGDKMRVSVEFKALSEDQKPELNFVSSQSAENAAITPIGFEGKKYVWEVTFTKVGQNSAEFVARHGAAEVGRHKEQFGIVADLADFIMGVTSAQSQIIGKFASASSVLSQAAGAFRAAKADQEAALADVGAKEKLAQDLLFGALLAAAGGLAGGAVGGAMAGGTSSNIAKALKSFKDNEAVAHGAVTDLAKDTMKFAVRSSGRLVGGSGTSVKGDSTSAPAEPTKAAGGERSGQGADPLEFFTSVSGQIEGDKAKVQTALTEVIEKARQARNANSKADFDEDPMELATKQSDLDTITKDLKTDKKPYLKGLWATWLENYGYTAQFGATRYGDKWTGKSNISSKLKKAIMTAAKQCDENGEEWIAKFTEPARLKAEAEAAEKNKRTGYPAPYRPGSGSPDRY